MRKLLFASLLFASVSHARPLSVLVDPGHGGSDTGAIRGNLKESEVVLNIANYLVELLSANKDFVVHSTRNTDKLVTLEERTQLADEKKADVFVSVHANSSPSANVKGTEIYFQNQMPADVETQYLANRENAGVQSTSSKPKGDLAAILQDLHHQNQIYLSSKLALDVYRAWGKRRKNYLHLRQAPFHVLSEIKVPSVLVETGFVTNEQDSVRLSEPTIQREIAQILYEGLQSYRQQWLSAL
jgi:N-acetylmuramoyl-L-alanine amidase